jgi:hypothetical protein
LVNIYLILVQPVKTFFANLLKSNLTNLNIDKVTFLEFFDTVIKNIRTYIPDVLRVLILLVFKQVAKIFTIEPENYAPVYTVIFFNFLLSPRIQEIYEIGVTKYPIIKSLNRIIRVNIKFI